MHRMVHRLEFQSHQNWSKTHYPFATQTFACHGPGYHYNSTNYHQQRALGVYMERSKIKTKTKRMVVNKTEVEGIVSWLLSWLVSSFIPTWSPLVTVAVVFTSWVTTRCSCRSLLCVVVVATVFVSNCCVRSFLPRSSWVVAVRVVTAVAVTYPPTPPVFSSIIASAWLIDQAKPEIDT